MHAGKRLNLYTSFYLYKFKLYARQRNGMPDWYQEVVQDHFRHYSHYFL